MQDIALERPINDKWVVAVCVRLQRAGGVVAVVEGEGNVPIGAGRRVRRVVRRASHISKNKLKNVRRQDFRRLRGEDKEGRDGIAPRGNLEAACGGDGEGSDALLPEREIVVLGCGVPIHRVIVDGRVHIVHVARAGGHVAEAH